MSLRIAYKASEITISAPNVLGEELITVRIERLEINELGQIVARTPAIDIASIKASDLNDLLPGQIDGDAIRVAVRTLSNVLIAQHRNLQIGLSGYPEEAV